MIKIYPALLRQSIIKLFRVQEKDLYINDLVSFDVAFTTNSVAGNLSCLENRSIHL